MANKSMVTLTDEEQAQLQALTKRGIISARCLPWARMVLQADAGLSTEAMA
jgi:hypothetical protein